MPLIYNVRIGDRVLLYDGTITFYGKDPIPKRHIEAVYHDGQWHEYGPTMKSMTQLIATFFFS